MSFKNEMYLSIEGHVKIKEFLTMDDLKTDKNYNIILDKRNSIHPENCSLLIARGLANANNGGIYSMSFGTGGATVDNVGNIQYASPNTIGNADLNTPSYFKVLNNVNDSTNIMIVRHINGVAFSDVEIHCVLDKNEPYGQPASDSTGSSNINNSQFVFDEIGLKSADSLLLTHITFNPIQKSSSRIMEVIYTIRININQG